MKYTEHERKDRTWKERKGIERTWKERKGHERNIKGKERKRQENERKGKVWKQLKIRVKKEHQIIWGPFIIWYIYSYIVWLSLIKLILHGPFIILRSTLSRVRVEMNIQKGKTYKDRTDWAWFEWTTQIHTLIFMVFLLCFGGIHKGQLRKSSPHRSLLFQGSKPGIPRFDVFPHHGWKLPSQGWKTLQALGVSEHSPRAGYDS